MSNQLNPGQQMVAGSQLTSPDGHTVLSMQHDGNLVLFNSECPVWQTATVDMTNGGLYYATIPTTGSNEGQLVIYNGSDNSVVWNTPNGQGSNANLQVLDTGFAQLFEGENTCWQAPVSAPQLTETLEVQFIDPNNNVLFDETYAYQAAPPGTAGPNGTTEATHRWKLINQKVAPGVVKAPALTNGARPNGTSGTVTDVLAVAKFFWEFIKASSPIANIDKVTTSILSAADTSTLNYGNASQGQSQTYTFRGTIWPTNYVQWEIVVGVSGYYGATPNSTSPAPAGQYLPWIQVTIPSCRVYWPYSVNASASVGAPVNTGTDTQLVVEADLAIALHAQSFWDSFDSNPMFHASGSNGFTYKAGY